MKLENYDIESATENTVFEFTSIGLKGKIPKIIQFENTALEGVYNLAFGDKNLSTGEMDDLSISNNGDTQKVLATVVAALFLFFDTYPDAFVIASGSSPSRTRLYQMEMSRLFDQMLEYFEVLGETIETWEPFRIGSRYISFLVKRKFV